MVQRDTGDNRYVRIDNIGSIQPSAQPHFQNNHVQRRLFKQLQRRQRTEFKIGQRGVAASRFNRSKAGGMRRFRQLIALNAHAFGIAQQMRGAVDADPITSGHQQRFQRAASGAFAISSGNGENKGGGF